MVVGCYRVARMTSDRDPQAGTPDPFTSPPDLFAGTPDARAGTPGPPAESDDPFATPYDPFAGSQAAPAAEPEPESAPGDASPRRTRLRRVGAAAGWLALAALIAFGGAGVVAVTNKPPVAGARPELTWTVDRALEPELGTAIGDLGAVSDDVDGLGDIGRRALTTLVDRNTTGLAEGDQGRRDAARAHLGGDRHAPGPAGGDPGDRSGRPDPDRGGPAGALRPPRRRRSRRPTGWPTPGPT